jgi:NADPH2:quinone reductase
VKAPIQPTSLGEFSRDQVEAARRTGAATYRALVCSALTPDLSGLSIESLPVRTPGPGQVRARVRAASLNFPDLLMTQGGYQFKPELPFVPGLEGAGEVIETGPGVEGFSPGDAIMLHSKTGCFAQEMVLPADGVRRMPAGLDFAQAAGFQAAAVTAYVALVRRGNLQAGETLLVHGASGGVGMAAVQLARHLGATVIATGSSEEKLAVVRANGAHHTLVVGEGFREQVKALTDGRGADVVFDPVGGDVFDESLRCIAWGGRLLVIGFVSSSIPKAPANIVLIKGISVVGVRAGEYGRRDPEKGAENLRAVDRLANEGVFRPHICARLRLDDAIEGLRMLAERRVVGKVVIEP